jgi:hypothetical protein
VRSFSRKAEKTEENCGLLAAETEERFWNEHVGWEIDGGIEYEELYGSTVYSESGLQA